MHDINHAISASHGQRLLWLLEHYRSHDGALNCPLLFRIRGPLDVTRLQRALQALCQRHSALRTRFQGRGNRLAQQVQTEFSVSVTQCDLRGGHDVDAALQRALREEEQRPIDTQEAPLRITLFRTADDVSVLCLNVHHLVTDGFSCALIFRDLRSLLAADDAALPPVRWQYTDFVREQDAYLRAGGLSRARDYWRARLHGAEQLRLRSERSVPPDTALESTTLRGDIPTHVAAGMRDLAASVGTTTFSLALANYYLLLSRETDQTDLTVASLMANRAREELQNTVGFVANMVLLRTALTAHGSFAELVQTTHATVVAAFTHQTVPFHILPPDVLPKGTGRSDDVVFQMIPSPIDRCSVGALEIETLLPSSIGSRFKLELELWSRDQALSTILYFRTDLFDRDWAERFLRDYIALCAITTRAPQARNSALLAALRAQR